ELRRRREVLRRNVEQRGGDRLAVRGELADVGVAGVGAGDAEEVEREGALRVLAAAGETLGDRDAAGRRAVLVDPAPQVLDQSEPAGDCEDAARRDREVVRR